MKVTKKSSKQADILFILTSSFIVVVAWIGFNIYHVYVTSTISTEVQEQLEPIDATFDSITIQSLKSRDKVRPVFEKSDTAVPTVSPTPLPTNVMQSPPATDSSRFAPTSMPINRTGQ